MGLIGDTMSENLQKFAFAYIFITISFSIINLSGVFPIAFTIAGYPAIQELGDTVLSITQQFQSAGNTLEYLYVVGFAAIMSIKVIILFLLIVFFGFTPIFELLSIPALMYAPLIVAINCLILYDFAKILAGIR